MMQHGAPPESTNQRQQGLRFFAGASFAGVAAAFIFVGFPQIDFAVTNLFYQGNRAFVSNFPGLGQVLRAIIGFFFMVAVAASIIGLIAAAFFQRKLLTLGLRQWLFLVACLALGPGLVANVLFKDNWGRARPFHVQEYGGDQIFTPALYRSDQCMDNCSFISGEASSIYMLFFALALLLPRRRGPLIAIGIAGGTLAGFVRIAQGGHFLSDVVFAGVLMALIAQAIYWLIFDLAGNRLSDDSPLQAQLNRAGQTMTATGAKAARATQTYARDTIAPAVAKGTDRLKRLRARKSEAEDGAGSDIRKPGGDAEAP